VLAAVDGPIGKFRWNGFASDAVSRWAWPEAWVVLPLMIWGFWRSLQRGWKLWRRRETPSAWLLPLYTVVAMTEACLHAPGRVAAGSLLTLASLAVLLGIYGIADLVRGFMEMLVLAPPHERAA
jgi:hypothetical protein